MVPVTFRVVLDANVLFPTNNLKDFRVLPEGIEAQAPDEFLVDLFDLDSQGVVALLRAQARALEKPPKTFEELMDGLAKTVPSFVKAVREHLSEHD